MPYWRMVYLKYFYWNLSFLRGNPGSKSYLQSIIPNPSSWRMEALQLVASEYSGLGPDLGYEANVHVRHGAFFDILDSIFAELLLTACQ